MNPLAEELRGIINNHLPALQSIGDKEMTFKSSPVKWSKKEIIGHMIDSAQNNIRRLIVGQYEDHPLIVYNQDTWVASSGYQQFDTAELLQLWSLLNKQLSFILDNMDLPAAARLCKTPESHSLEWLAEDYIKHLKHHLHQVLDLEPLSYP